VLGQVGELDLSKARSSAKGILARVRLGADPAAEKIEARQKTSSTFGALLPRYLIHARARLKPRSYDEVARHLELHARPFHNRAIESIDRRSIAIRLAEIAESGPSAANRTRSSLATYFGWLLREGLLEGENPVLNTNKATEGGARSRLLSDNELRQIWCALGDDQYSAIIKLLILSGCRRREIGDLCWSEVDLDSALITLSGARTKNKREFLIPLAPTALTILKQQPRRPGRNFVFGFAGRGWRNWSASKADLDARIQAPGKPIPSWCLHDFRRLVSTRMHETLDVMPHIVEATLGHTVSGIAGVYNKSSYIELRRAAMERWENYVTMVVTGKRPIGSIVKLRRA
jgi:integrase